MDQNLVSLIKTRKAGFPNDILKYSFKKGNSSSNKEIFCMPKNIETFWYFDFY